MSSSSKEDQLRLEKKVDVLLECVQRLMQHLSVKDGLFPPLTTPLSQASQICPLCQHLIEYLVIDGAPARRCGCQLPAQAR